ncbi:Lymphoid-specific helicase [Paramyrothecium foliicola]|nr:Lymphoid-specific helicase [Paramyrothecium foliicola]
MDTSSASEAESILSKSKVTTSLPSSPPSADSPSKSADMDEDTLEKEEEKARLENTKIEEKRRAELAKKRRKRKAETKAEREAKAHELDELLMKSAAFSDILSKKTQVLGRVGSSLDGKSLGEHNLQMASQPKCMVNGTMRDYQLEGLTWMFEICSQGMSGILADEMGLGKTVQTISLIALLREQENYLGPHLIVAPLSTLSNWMEEFEKWTPSIPVTMYHGTKPERDQIFRTKMMRNLTKGRPNDKFPVVCTSYEMVLRDQANLSKINWEFIIIDEGHRMKNADAKLFQQLRQFTSATRLLITGTPLQNNLKELWSLLHFLLPNIFTDWEAFESWFDFSDLEDEKSTEEFIEDKMKQDLVKKMHLILQPLLLRRVKQDVAAYLPKKREYVLFAPMTKEQTDLYNVLGNKEIDARAFLEDQVVEKIKSAASSKQTSRASTRSNSAVRAVKPKQKTSAGETTLAIRESPRKIKSETKDVASPVNAFAMMMGKRGPSKAAQNSKAVASTTKTTPAKNTPKRKAPPTAAVPDAKSARSSRQSTPASVRRTTRKTRTYKDADSDEEKMSDDEFEAKLANEMVLSDEEEESKESSLSPEEEELAQSIELAKKQVAQKKLGNPLAQLRLACNSPHNFYNPWAIATDLPVDETIVTSSGKMMLLDRLLPALFKDGHKVLIFSQFTTQLDILEDYCQELRGWKICRVDGSVSQASRREQIREFNTDPEYKIFLLSTRAGGQGINLASADTVILFDSDFNPQQDLQAQDRCHRIGQTRPVIVYRLATKDTVEESLLMSADAKRRLEKLVIKKGGFKTMGQKLDNREDLDSETLRALLLKDGQVYNTCGGEQVLNDDDLRVLCDRSEAAYERAAKGEGDADGYRVVETGADSIKMARKNMAPITANDRQRRIIQLSQQWGIVLPPAPTRLFRPPQLPSFQAPGDDLIAEDLLQRRALEVAQIRPKSGLSRAFSTNNLKKGKHWDPRDILDVLSQWVAVSGSPGVAQALLGKLSAAGVDLGGMKQKSGVLSRRRSVDTLVDRSKLLKSAIETNQLDMVHVLLPHADSLALDTCLPMAIRSGNTLIVELLLKYGASVSQTPDGQDAFRQACVAHGQAEMISLLLQSDGRPSPALVTQSMIDAARLSCLEIVMHLSRSTADGNYNQAEALQAAVSNGRRDIAIAIIMGNKPPQCPGLNAAFEILYNHPKLNAASKLELAELLLCAGAEGDVLSQVLERSCETQFYEMAGLLAAYGVSIEHNGAAALKNAIKTGQWELVNALLNERSSLSPPAASACVSAVPRQIPPEARHRLLTLLLKKGANGVALHECLIHATEAGDVNSVELLLNPYFPDARQPGRRPSQHGRHEVASPDYKTGEALRTAVLRGDTVLVQKILSGKPSAETLTAVFPLTRSLPPKDRYHTIELFLQGPLSGNCLHSALQGVINEEASQRDDSLVKLLLDHGADVNYESGMGLHAIIMQKDLNLMASLMQKASPQTAAAQLSHVMDVPDHRIRHDMMSMLLRAGAAIGVTEVASSLSRTLTEKPVDMSLLRLLLQHGSADINILGGAIVKAAIANPDPKVLELVLGLGKPKDETLGLCLTELAPVPSTEGKTWKLDIILARSSKKPDLSEMLVQEVQSLLRNNTQKPSLSTAKKLLESGADPNGYKAAALCHAIVAANSHISDLILESSTAPTPISLGYALPHALHIADPMDRLTFTKKLVDAGAFPLEVNRALMHAIATYSTDLTLISTLASAADTTDGDALGLAVAKELPEVLELLLIRTKHTKATRNAILQKSMQIKNRSVRDAMCQRLLKSGVSGEAASDALLIAARDGDIKLGDNLMAHGASISSKSGQAIVEACRGGSVEVLEVLLKTDVDADGRMLEKAFQATTEVADLNKRAMIFAQLVRKGVSGEIVDAQLQSAARSGEVGQEVLRVLLAAGADPNYNEGGAVVAATRSAFIGNLELLLGIWKDGGNQKKPSPATLVRALKASWELTRDNRFRILSDLFKAGLPVTEDLHIALNNAVNEEEPEERLVRLLLEHGASPVANECKTLMDATRNPQSSVFSLLMAQDLSSSDINQAFSHGFAADNFDAWFTEDGLEIARLLLQKGTGGAALSGTLLLVMKNSDERNDDLAETFFDLLIGYNPDVDFDEGCLLREAASKANFEWSHKLLACGPSATTISNAFHHIFDTALSEERALELFEVFTDHQQGESRVDVMASPPGSQPVLVQAMSQFPRSLKILETLLNAGYYYDQATKYKLYPDLEEEEITLLTWAIAQPQKRISSSLIQLLIDRGAKINVETALSRTTPLMLAVETRRPDVVKMLLLDGAEVDIIDYQGRTPLSLATQIGGDLAIQMMGNLLAAEPSKDDGSLHNAARELNLPAVRVLVQAGHDPDFPSPLHEGRSALAEVCLRGSDAGELNVERERAMQKVVGFLIEAGSDLSIRSNGKSVLHLCMEARDPVATTRILLKVGMWKHINKPYNYYDNGEQTYSPTMYVSKVLPPSDSRDALLALLRANRAIDVYYANEGPQPQDAVGLPEDMAVEERVRKARLQRIANESQDHAISLARRREIANVEQQILAQKAEMEDARRKRMHNEDINAIRSRAQLDESLSAASLSRRLSEQRALTEATLSRNRAVAAAELEAEEQRQRKALEWESKLNTERVGNARAVSALRLSEREELERIEYKVDERVARRLERQQKLVESQEKLAKTLAEAPRGGAVDPRRQIGYVTELN